MGDNPQSKLDKNDEATKKTSKDDSSLAGEFVRSALYSGIQSPLNGLTQLADEALGTDLLPNVQFMDAPAAAEFGSAKWHAQTAGAGVGMIAPFLLASKATRGAMTKLGIASEASASSNLLFNARNGLAITESAVSGFAYDSLMRPVDASEGNFWTARLKHGAVGAATFATLTASSIGLRATAGTAFAEATSLSPLLKNDIVTGTLSGIPAGLTSAELDSVIGKGRHASAAELTQSMYSMAFVGGGLSAMHQLAGQPERGIQRVKGLGLKGENALTTALGPTIGKSFASGDHTAVPPKGGDVLSTLPRDGEPLAKADPPVKAGDAKAGDPPPKTGGPVADVPNTGDAKTSKPGAANQLDGSLEHRLNAERAAAEKAPVEVAKKPLDVDGRPEEGGFRKAVRDKFGNLTEAEIAKSVADVKTELESVKAVGPDGKESNARDSLMNDPTLSDAQKENVLRNLAQVREHFANYRQGERMHADPEVNWIHTQGELAKVLEAGRAKKLSPEKLEDTLLASMYSDSVKFAFPPPKGAEANFFTHHLDGALAAHENLTKQGYPPERVQRIVKAILEHQIAPPEFMGQLYHFKAGMGLEAAKSQGTITPDEYARLKGVFDAMTVVGADGKARIKQIADVENMPKVQNAKGDWEVDLTPDQRRVLGFAGVDAWYVPVDPRLTPGFQELPKPKQQQLIDEYDISKTLIDGDAVDNYATLGGASKIVAIRGPETMFKDGTVWHSVESIDTSYRDAYTVLSPEGKKLADATLAERNVKLNDGKTGIRAQMDAWLKTKGLDPATEEIPFYNKDLKYPEGLSKEEQATFNTLNPKKAAGTLSTEEAAQLRGLQYKGLTEAQISQFEFAKQIRNEMTNLLRRGHRTDGALPGNFSSNRSQPH